MKKIFFYSCIIITNLIPFIPLSNKGILGLIFILFCSVKFEFKETIRTAIILIILGVFSYIMGFSVDYKDPIISLCAGSLIYLIIAYTLGSYIEKNKSIIKELKQQMSLQDRILVTMTTPIFIKDLSFKYLKVNPSFEDFFGVVQEDIIGRNAFYLCNNYLADISNQMDMELIQTLKEQVKEITFEMKDGNTKSVIVIKNLITDHDDKPIGILGVVIDITDKKESEKLKEEKIVDRLMIDLLQKEDQLKTDFFANISHELRTPINVIHSAVQLIEIYMNNKDYVIDPNKIGKSLLNIKQNSFRLQRLVNNLIDITKIDSKSFDLKLQNLDVINVVEEITLSVVDFAVHKDIYIEFDTNVEEKIMAFDEVKIERIILNLLSNAIKYTPSGGSISVCIFDKGGTVTLEIKDTGIGIPQGKLAEIFNRFYQIYPVNTRNQEGSGIGLNLVKSLVEMHLGVITVESILGKGTTFSIELPCRTIENEEVYQIKSSNTQSRIEQIQVEFSDIYEINNIRYY